LCITVALIFAMRRARGNPGSIITKSLVRVKGVRFLPVISLVYVFYAAVVLFFGLQLVEIASGYEHYFFEDNTLLLMSLDKQTKKYDYPLMAIKGRDSIGEKERPRILVLGDSFVWGQGLSNVNQIWWNMMARELERRGYDCEVYAVGVGGASTYDEFVWLRDTSVLEDIQPDLIIVGYVTNDPYLSWLYDGKGEWELVVSYSDRALACGWLRALFPGLYDYLNMLSLMRIYNENGNIYAAWVHKLVESENLERYDKYVLQPMGGFIRESGIPMIVIPTSIGLLDDIEDCKDVMPLFERAGFPVYDPLRMLYEHASLKKYRRLMYANPIDPHPGPAASWLLGQYAADVVEQDYAAIMARNGNEGGQSTYVIEINDWLPCALDPQPIRESGTASQYGISYPSQAIEAVPFIGPYGEEYLYDGFLRLPNGKKYVKLNFKYPVRISSVRIDGEDLLSAEMYTLAVNEDLGFDDQKPVSLGERRGTQCVWEDGSGRYITSLLLSAKTKEKASAYLSVIIESQGGEGAFY